MLLYLWGLSRCCCNDPVPDAFSVGGFGTAALADLDGYTISGDSWSNKTDLPSPARDVHAGAAIGGYGYAMGGFAGGFLADNDQYNPSGDSWANMTDLPSPGRNQLAAVGHSSKVYAFGGASSGPVLNSQNDQYDPSGDSWASKSALPSPARMAHAHAAVGSYLYSWAGADGISPRTFIQDNDRYDPSGDSWANMTSLPSPPRDAVTGGGSQGGKGYVICGRAGTPPISDNDEYDPGTDSWAAKTPNGIDLYYLAVCSTSDGKVRTFGGFNSIPAVTSTHQCYDPGTDSWQSAAALPSPSRAENAAFVP